MESPEPLYVSHRKWLTLVIGTIVFFLALGPTVVFLIPLILEGDYLSFPALFFYVWVFLFSCASIWCVHAFVVSRRIEFYHDFVKVRAPWGGDEKDIPYSQLSLGRPWLQVVKGYNFISFRIREKGKHDSLGWEIRDGAVKGEKISIYTWLFQRIS